MARHTQIEVREKVIKYTIEGKSCRKIALLLSISKTTVNDIIAKYRSGFGLEDRPRSGRPRKTSSKEDKIIKEKSAADVNKTAAEIARELKAENVANISRRTVTRRLHEKEPNGCVGVKKPLCVKIEGKTSSEIAFLLSRSKSKVKSTTAKCRSGLGLEDRPRSGRLRKTSRKKDRIIKKKSTAGVNKTTAEIARELKAENVANISQRTETRRLHEKEPNRRVGVKKSQSARKNKKASLELDKEHFNGLVKKTEKRSRFPKNRNLIFSEVMPSDMCEVLLVEDT